MKIEQLYKLFLQYRKITTDSRNIESNSIFFALKGENYDGNKYAKSALDNGCSCAVIDNPEYNKGENYIFVDSVLETLQLLANYHRKQLNIPIIAITGTNGKTTTKELVSNVLEKKFKIANTKGNLNNHIGVPLTLLSMTRNTEIGVVEMGANHVSEIKLLSEIANPDFGIITNIGKAHLEGFGSFDNIVKTKAELYEFIKDKGGKVFYNTDNIILKRLIDQLELNATPFGDKNSEVYGEVDNSEQFLTLNISIGDYHSKICTQLIGNYNLENILAAASIGHYFEVDSKLIAQAIEEYTPQNNRSQFLKTKKNNLFLDAYNANPTSVEASIKNFASLNNSNTCIILGDMLELGKDSIKEHKSIIKLLHSYSFDKIILVGEIFYSIKLNDDFTRFKSTEELIDWLRINSINNLNVLIKGSRGIQLEKIVEFL
ncbi:UDP-N-acetylmuramoyl-tripeptide--D-alanyl-D-alanine ligase [Bacteroidota bacterium]